MDYMSYIQPIAFFVITLFLSGYWAKILFSKRTRLGNFLTLYLVTILRLTEREAYALLMSFTYYAYGIAVSLILLFWFQIDIAPMFAIDREIAVMILLGAMAQLSTIRLFTSLYAVTHLNVNIVREIREVSWIDGISRCPSWFTPFSPLGGAFVEEFFFRGALLAVFVQKMSIPPYLSLLIITICFLFEQLSFLETSVQKTVIGIASVIISVLGGVLVFYTGSLLPAMVAHASFVMFYFGEMNIIE
jgi:membrane protease YdiL (CAAX protease family)